MNLRLLLIFLSLFTGNSCIAQPNPFEISDAGLDYLTGQALFEKNWVSSPSSTQASDGLGPQYNARSCVQCHAGAGKGSIPQALTIRVEHDYFGKQLQNRAISGLPAEAEIEISYSSTSVVLADNMEIVLHEPQYSFSSGETVQKEILEFSPRLAPALFGVGLLETIPQQELLAKVDADDSDGDGISGKAGLGRFGWKADIENLDEQTGLALSLDLGISSELFPNHFGDCTAQQVDCLSQPNGASSQHQNLELGHTAFASLLNFVRNIPLPTINESNIPSAGRTVFENIACLNCHQIGYMQGTINPYSDLLLHDMGDALADTFDGALSREWRTPPLWGLTVYQQGNEEQFYLHDGRAKSLEEAILWHGGEAERSVEAFKALSIKEREDLINFLQSI